MSGRRSWGRLSLTAASCGPRGALGPGSERPDPRPARAGQGDHQTTPGASDPGNRGRRGQAFPGPTGLRTAGPSTWGGPEDIPCEGNFPKGPPEGAKRPRAAATAASRTSTAGLLGSGRHPGDKRVRPRCRGRDPGSDPRAPGRRRGLPPCAPRRSARARSRGHACGGPAAGVRSGPAASRHCAAATSVLHAPPPARPSGPAARRYEYVKRLYCPPRPRPRRGPARARARRPGGGEGPVPAGGGGPGRGRPGSRRAGPQPPLPRVFPLRPAAPSLSPPPLGARRGLRAPRPPSSPPLIIIILSTNKLC